MSTQEHRDIVQDIIETNRNNGCEYTARHDDVKRTMDESVQRLKDTIEKDFSSYHLLEAECNIISGAMQWLDCYYYDAIQGFLDCNEHPSHRGYTPNPEKEAGILQLLKTAKRLMGKIKPASGSSIAMNAFCKAVKPRREQV